MLRRTAAFQAAIQFFPGQEQSIMKLRYSPTSPFVRKVAALAIETGLHSKIERQKTTTADPDLLDDNPLGKVPALVTDDGIKMYDSPVICEYLDSLHSGRKMFPAAGKDRWAALRHQALGDGLMEAGLLAFVELRKPAEKQMADFITKQLGKAERACKVLENEIAVLEGPVTIGHLAVACGINYADRRIPEFGWRKTCPKLAKWYETFCQRPSMKDTAAPES
ncbi:MAG: glutathione S-transferase N-terminal domain-containing protein [Proteobacteria bacterium]|nr:glutathione S-transferase N-terminal domain-containing protein [Pseudomonadota bacterium]